MKFKLGLVSALLLLSPFGASAMTILDFMRLNDDDGSTYITLLVQGAAKNLRAHGQPDKATQVIALFKNATNHGGVHQLVLNLKGLNEQNNRNATNPNNRAKPYDIEDGMAATLEDNDIKVSANDLRAIGKDFSPSGPPRGRAPIMATH